LKRLTNETNKVGVGVGGGSGEGKGEGKGRRSLDELSRTPKEGEAEREVVVHLVSGAAEGTGDIDDRELMLFVLSQLLKTDTIASISLQYGITVRS
jgi:hypothetical protein